MPRRPWLNPERPPRAFAAIDFETADYGRDSACAVAIVRVEDGQIVARGERLIRPPRRAFLFTHIHGITWRRVAEEPSFAEVWPQLAPLVEGCEFFAAHNASFDRGVLHECCFMANLPRPELSFRCTVQLARQMWQLRPANLPAVCSFLNIPLTHHNAGSDAEACARIILAALERQAVATAANCP